MWMHKESKWLVKGRRKVRCYLCGKKILKKDPFMFHENTGYYSHNFCIMEANTIDRNERRKAVKKIAVGAAVVGAMAAGAGKFIDISSQSKGSNSPDTQTILTSQGLILPALTSDPANPVAGQMWYRSDAGVTAHFDSIQNRVVYSSELNNGMVNVTSKGIINGLSVLVNDGTGGFGPDTTKGATAPGQCGSPYTQTTGTQEMLTFIGNNTISGINFKSTPISQYNVRFMSGIYLINTTILYPNVATKIYGGGAYLKWNGTTSAPIMQYAQPNLYVNYNYISDLLFDPNSSSSTPASYGLYFNQTAAEANNANIYERLTFREGFTEKNGGMVISGEATDRIIGCNFGLSTLQNTQAGLNCSSGGSDIYIIDCIFLSSDGANLNIQLASFESCILTQISLVLGELMVVNSYWLGADTYPTLTTPCISLPQGFFGQVSVLNSTIGVGNLRPFIGSGAAPVQLVSLEVSNCNFSVVMTTSGVTTAAMITGSLSTFTTEYIMSLKLENNLILMSNDTDTFTGPFTMIPSPNTTFNSSGNQYLMGKAIPTTPSVPASGTAQQNTNPYKVKAYLNGGVITQIVITRAGNANTVLSNSSGVAMAGQDFELDRQDSITLTYTTAPTWEWL